MLRFSGGRAVFGKAIRVALALALCASCLVAPAPTATAASAGNGPEDRELESSLTDHLSGLDGVCGVAAVNLKDGRTVSIDVDSSFPTASMYKLFVMYRVFQALDRGSLSPNDTVTIEEDDVIQDEPDGGFAPGDTPTVSKALEAMITLSSNAAALALTRDIGGWPEVESAARELGMTKTTTVDGDLWSTPSDMAHFFQLLASQSLVGKSASVKMIGLLLQQTVNDRLPALLPPEAAVAHKTGELDDVWNDAGIVYGTGGSYVIVVMSRGGTPEDEIRAEAELSQMVYAQYGK